MRKQKIIIDFSKYADTELDQKADQIVENLSNPPGSTNFPTPQPTIVIVQGKIDAYKDALANLGKGTITTAAKDVARKELEDTLAELGLYIQQASGGDVVKMLSSGFDISKASADPVGDLPKPGNFKAKAKGKGEIDLSCDPIKGAKIYQWEYKQVAATEWILKTTTKAKLSLTGLESGKEYVFRVVALGTSKAREYSDEVKSFVL